MRKTTLAFTLVAALVLTAALVAPGMVGAHGRQSAAGLNFVFGALDEPITTGQRTWLELRVSDAATEAPAEGLAENLTLTLQMGEHEKTLNVNPVRNTPGSYRAPVWFTQAGDLTVIARGQNAAGEAFELTFTTKVEDAADLYAGEAEAAAAAPMADITLPVGSTTATVSGETVTLDVPAQIVDGRTMVPLRFIAESLGMEVHWDNATKTVHIGPEEMMGAGGMPGLDHGSMGSGGSAPAGQPVTTYTLRMFIDGFVGVGGDIDGVKNPVLKARAGEIIKVDLINGDELEHDWVIDELGAHSDHVFAVGERTSATFTASKTGTFFYYCSVTGHRRAGMEGNIEVSG